METKTKEPGEAAPTYGAWLTHHCDPPCVLEAVADRQAARKKMTKFELVLQAEASDDTFLDMSEGYEMLEEYQKDILAHLKTVHGCDHDIYADKA